MRYLVLAVVVLVGCDDPVEPEEENGPVTVLQALPEENLPEISLVDLNKNGQALWLEDGAVVLWDNGDLTEPIDQPVTCCGALVSRHVAPRLGPGGAILARSENLETSFLWNGEGVMTFSGYPVGFTDDGTPFIKQEGEIMSWDGSSLQPTDLPSEGRYISLDGRVFDLVDGPNEGAADFICRMWDNGEWSEWDFGRVGCIWTETAGNGVALMWSSSGYMITGFSDEAIHVGRAEDVNSSAQALVDAARLTEPPAFAIWEDGETSLIDTGEWFLHEAGSLNDNGEVLAWGEDPDGNFAILLIETR